MNKARIVVSMAILFPLQVFAAQQPLQTRANTTSPSVDTNFSRQQLMNTEIYTTKADKDKVVRVWTDFPDGGDAISVGTPVWYDGKLYNTIQAFVKTAGATPDTFTEYFEVASGNGGTNDYNDLVNTPTIPTALADLTTDSTHRVVTDAEKTAWNALVLGADDQTASEVNISDAGNHFTGTNVETALAELGVAPFISWDAATIVETEDSPTAGTNTIGVKPGVFQASDTQLDIWAGVTPGTGVATALAANVDTVGGLPTLVAKGAYTVDTASIAANTCASVVAVTAAGVATTDVIIATPNAILSTVAGFGVSTSGAVRVDIYPTSGNVNFQFCNPTGAAIDPESVTFNWKVLR